MRGDYITLQNAVDGKLTETGSFILLYKLLLQLSVAHKVMSSYFFYAMFTCVAVQITFFSR